MEAATVPASPAVKGDRLKAFIGTYGLIAVLLALPVYFAIYDLVNDGDLSRIGNNLVDGISNGAIWALVAIGYTLVYGIVELINFAHGEVFMIGSFISASLFATFGLTEDTTVLLLAIALLVILVICDVRLGHPQHDDRAGRLPAVAQRAEARAADHRRRLLLHPAERRPAVARRLAGGHPGPDPLAARGLLDRRGRRSPTATCSRSS